LALAQDLEEARAQRDKLREALEAASRRLDWMDDGHTVAIEARAALAATEENK
jgi:hypothetical protein